MVKFKVLMATLTLLGGFLFAACDTENVRDTYTPTNQSISFEQKQLPQALSTNAEYLYEVKLLRVKSDGNYTAHYTLTTETADNFVDETQGSVSFESGQNAATIKVKATGMEKGKIYKAILALAESEKGILPLPPSSTPLQYPSNAIMSGKRLAAFLSPTSHSQTTERQTPSLLNMGREATFIG